MPITTRIRSQSLAPSILVAASLALGVSAIASAQSADASLPATTSVPKVYVFPLIGQMGTDISDTSFEVITKDLDKAKPDIIVFRVKSADVDRNDDLKNDDPNEFGLPGAVGSYRQMLKDIRDKFRDTPQVVWVEDTVGISSLFALGWPRLYMHPEARLQGCDNFRQSLLDRWEDPDVGSKMVAAWTGIMKGFVEIGGYPREVADALIFPESLLSVTVEDGGATWFGDLSGELVVDGCDRCVARFDAGLAQNSGLVKGSAASLEELMQVLGYREFEKLDSGEKVGAQYIKDWRKAMDECFRNLEDARETEDAQEAEVSLAGLHKRMKLYEETIALMKRYPVIERRLEMQKHGISVAALEGAVAEIEKEIRRLEPIRVKAGATNVQVGGKETVFILPWGRGPGGDVDMVGLGARHEEIEKIGAEADKIGPGQIIVLEINSGGGLVLEGEKIDETLNKLRERHRVIAWIHEAISAAAFTSLHCNEIYFQRVGTLGAITMFAGPKSIEGSELGAWLKKVGDVCEATKRNRWIGEAMVTNEPELSYDKDEEGNITWYNTLQGKYDLSDKVQNLTINAQQAEHSKFSQGTADTIPDLLKLLNLSPDKVEISQAGYKIHNEWQATMKQCKEAKIKLLSDMQNPPGLTQLDQLNARLCAAKEIREWFDKCFPIMTYDGPFAGSPEQWDGIIEDLSRQIKEAGASGN